MIDFLGGNIIHSFYNVGICYFPIWFYVESHLDFSYFFDVLRKEKFYIFQKRETSLCWVLLGTAGK